MSAGPCKLEVWLSVLGIIAHVCCQDAVVGVSVGSYGLGAGDVCACVCVCGGGDMNREA
jgi:hypothetical protein